MNIQATDADGQNAWLRHRSRRAGLIAFAVVLTGTTLLGAMFGVTRGDSWASGTLRGLFDGVFYGAIMGLLTLGISRLINRAKAPLASQAARVPPEILASPMARRDWVDGRAKAAGIWAAVVIASIAGFLVFIQGYNEYEAAETVYGPGRGNLTEVLVNAFVVAILLALVGGGVCYLIARSTSQARLRSLLLEPDRIAIPDPSRTGAAVRHLLPEAGWYGRDGSLDVEHYWNGDKWTGHTRAANDVD